MVAHTQGIFEVTFAVRQKSPNAEFFQIRIQCIMNTFWTLFTECYENGPFLYKTYE